EVARGIVAATDVIGTPVPIVVRLVGVNEVEGREILKAAGMAAFTSMDDAARAVVTALDGTVG
ncbi:MAG TPA: succinate--CoA ligase subunit beta, partial [Chloroflexota bacterium]|nr:succinate--CoA ligase subunit beta [Chloroflexota bacterium]